MTNFDVPALTGNAADDVELFLNALLEAKKVDVSDNPVGKLQVAGFERRLVSTLIASELTPRYAKEAARMIGGVKEKLANAEANAEEAALKIQALDGQEQQAMQDYTAAVVAGNTTQADDVENHVISISVEQKRHTMRRGCSLDAAAQLRQTLEALRAIFNACRMSMFSRQALAFVGDYEAALENFISVFRRMVAHIELTRANVDYSKTFRGGIIDDLAFRTGRHEQLSGGLGGIKGEITAAIDGQISAS